MSNSDVSNSMSNSDVSNSMLPVLFELLNLLDLKLLEKKLKSHKTSQSKSHSESHSKSLNTKNDHLLEPLKKSDSDDHSKIDSQSASHSESHSESEIDDHTCNESESENDSQVMMEYTQELSDNENDNEIIIDKDIEEEEDDITHIYDDESNNNTNMQIKTTNRKSIVDDDFFSLEEMEKFAELSEAQDIKMANKLANRKRNEVEQDSDFDENDMFSIGKDLATGDFDFDLDEDDEDGDNANNIRYEDFFVSSHDKKSKPARKNWKDDMVSINDNEPTRNSKETNLHQKDNVNQDHANQDHVNQDKEDQQDLFEDQEKEATTEQLSSFEKRQLRMQKSIEKLENENMAVKEWTMKGEVNAKARPVNSLLEQDLDVDIAAKPIPVITEETTQTLGELIIQRIRDNAFDDVVRKAPPKDSVYDPNRRWELDDEKSKKSLGEIYEQEYQKTVMNADIKSEKTMVVEESHKEITALMTNLFQQLDALSNFHYTPPPAELELEVIPLASAPAISMEEVIPAHVSSATLATPAEVYSSKLGKSQAELDKHEKTKLRRKAKRKAGEEKKQRESVKKAKLEKGGLLQHQISKQKAIHTLMGQKNVTLVVGGGKKASGVGMDRKKAAYAKTIREGEKVGPTKELFQASMLKL